MEGEETYSPVEASRVLGRSGRQITERRIRQMLQAVELEGARDEGGRWRIPRRVVHQLLTERREREQLREGPSPRPRVCSSAFPLRIPDIETYGASSCHLPYALNGPKITDYSKLPTNLWRNSRPYWVGGPGLGVISLVAVPPLSSHSL